MKFPGELIKLKDYLGENEGQQESQSTALGYRVADFGVPQQAA